jgi:hypothetical protein
MLKGLCKKDRIVVLGLLGVFTWTLAVLLYLAFDGIPTLQRDTSAYLAGNNGTKICQENGYDLFICQGGNLERCYCYLGRESQQIINQDGKWRLRR